MLRLMASHMVYTSTLAEAIFPKLKKKKVRINWQK